MEHLPRIPALPFARPAWAPPVREARRVHLPGLRLGAEPDALDDLRDIPTRQLRILCNRTYQLLELDRPSRETWELYDALVEELGRRETHAVQSQDAEDMSAGFRDDAPVAPLIPGGKRRRLRLLGAVLDTGAGQDRR